MNYVDTTYLEKILQTLQYHVLYINLPTKAGSGVHSMPSMPSFRTFFPAQRRLVRRSLPLEIHLV